MYVCQEIKECKTRYSKAWINFAKVKYSSLSHHIFLGPKSVADSMGCVFFRKRKSMSLLYLDKQTGIGDDYGSPISRDLTRLDFSLRDWISRDFGCEICEIKKGSKVPILVEKFSIFNQKLQIKMEKILLRFLYPPKS